MATVVDIPQHGWLRYDGHLTDAQVVAIRDAWARSYNGLKLTLLEPAKSNWDAWNAVS
jgi:hypothetical protein